MSGTKTRAREKVRVHRQNRLMIVREGLFDARDMGSAQTQLGWTMQRKMRVSCGKIVHRLTRPVR